MVIFKDYNTSDVLFDEPYVEDGRLTLYPVNNKLFLNIYQNNILV